MAVRHWYPLKIGIVWLIDLALFLVLWLLISPYRGNEKAFVIIIWLILSIPVFVITWKWASGRELEVLLKKNDISPPVKKKESTEFEQAGEAQTSKESEYRVHTLKISRSALAAGHEIHPRHFMAEGEEIEGWKLLSVHPLENKSDEEELLLLVVIERTLDL